MVSSQFLPSVIFLDKTMAICFFQQLKCCDSLTANVCSAALHLVNTLLYLRHCHAGLTAVFPGVLHQGIIDEMQPGLQSTRSLLKTTYVPLAIANHLNIFCETWGK